MKHSRFVRVRRGRRDGVAAVYRLSEPIEYGGGYGDDEEDEGKTPKTTQYIWVSAVPHVGGFEGPETYAFPFDDETDEVLDWTELPGSYKGGMSHRKCLDGLGFPCSDIPPEVEAE